MSAGQAVGYLGNWTNGEGADDYGHPLLSLYRKLGVRDNGVGFPMSGDVTSKVAPGFETAICIFRFQ